MGRPALNATMDVVYIHQYFNTPTMHGGTRSYEMARRLVNKGHRVRMVTSWRESSATTDWFVTNEDGIEVHWLPVPYGNEMTYGERIQAFVRFATRSARRAQRLPGDVVFATSTPLTVALPGAWAARRRRRPMVFEVRDLWPEMPIAVGALRDRRAIWAARQLEDFAYQSAARVVALSPGMADGVVATGYPRSRVCVIPNSCDFDRFEDDPAAGGTFRREHPELGDGPMVLYPGTMGRINGVEYLAELAAACRERVPAARFVVIGSGSERERVLARASELGVLNEQFFVYPSVTKVEVAAAFQAASVIVSVVADIPAVENNSANKFFDGLAAGRAIAINYGGWQADLLRQHDAGLVLQRDVSDAADSMVAWLSDPARLARAGRCARELGQREFSRDLLAARLERVLLDAVAEAA